MTPAERARQIDREEFAAECAAVRQRAYAYVEHRRHEARAELATWLGRPAPAGVFKVEMQPTRRRHVVAALERYRELSAKRHTVGGLTMTKRQWADYLGITYSALNTRISRLGSLEVAIQQRSLRRSGVSVAGMTKSVTEWADFLGIARSVLYHRIKTEPAETLIAAYLADPPGVVSNLPDNSGTGAGSTAQETPNLTFSGIEA